MSSINICLMMNDLIINKYLRLSYTFKQQVELLELFKLS